MSLLSRISTVVLVALAVLSSGLGLAAAHTGLAGSEPGEAQALNTRPRQITLTFTDAVRPGSAQVSVRGPDGRSVTSGPATVSEAVVQQPIEIGTDGSYLVAYRIVSQDGHPVSGEITFSYAGAEPFDAPPTAAAGSTDAASPTDSSELPVAEASADEAAGSEGGGVSPALWWMLGVSVAVVGGLAILALGRRRHGG